MHNQVKCKEIIFHFYFSMTNPDIWSNLESTDWFEYLHLLLKYSCEMLTRILQNETVIVHCHEGDDYTTQLVSLTELLIDSHFRTFDGFITLIEKEWVSFGHQFGYRNGITPTTSTVDDQRCPSFILFLDAVHQILNQFPHAFEFNNELIVFLAKASMTNLYGTFCFNNDRERKNYDANNNSTSVWSDVLLEKEKYINKFYEKENVISFLYPNYAQYKIEFWEEFFMMDSVFVRNNTFYLDENKKVEFKSLMAFYNWERDQDTEKIKKLEQESEDTIECLRDIFKVSEEAGQSHEIFDDITYNLIQSIEKEKKSRK